MRVFEMKKDSFDQHTGEDTEQTKAAYQEDLSTSTVYENIVRALSKNYFDLYYVNVETGEYIEYGSIAEEGKKSTEKRGADFFEESLKKAKDYIFAEDLEGLSEAIEKKKLLNEIKKHGTYIYTYRLLIDGTPTYVNLKATQVTDDDKHIIIGVSNVDSQVRDRQAAELAKEERQSYLRLSALNGNLLVLYYIDMEDDSYTEFRSSEEFKQLGIMEHGTDFFKTTYENSLRVIHPEDLSLFHERFTKENILSAIERDGVFILYYRLKLGNFPTYVRLKAAKVEEKNKSTLIIGVFDEDAQIRREQEYKQDLSVAKKMATIDSLTGIKNKHAYVELEEKIDAEIRKGEQEAFAIVVCDVNSLKEVNDLYGHKEGDACIKKACARICNTFSHSPVFRIGGDEFVAFLTGADYYRRKELLEEINAVPKDPEKIRLGETISAGIAEFNKTRHQTLLNVFEEADSAMYERKQFVKANLLPHENKVQNNETQESLSVIHSRKNILVVDDMEVNREILNNYLSDDYGVFTASDGVEAMDLLRSRLVDIDLVLLDLQMPNKDGREVIAEMKVDEELMSIPVVVFTVDEAAELDCLRCGAMDFIPKPYPDIEIVKARIAKCIELSENRELIRYTERDKLTGLLNKDYFYRYVIRLDHLNKDTALDAIVCDVSRFHAINKQYGRQFGDNVLRNIGAGMKKLARKTEGISCREGGDTFLLYCPHQDDYEQLIREFLSDLFDEKETADNIHIRVGVFTDAGDIDDIEERFTRAKIAADRVKDDPEKICGFFDLG